MLTSRGIHRAPLVHKVTRQRRIGGGKSKNYEPQADGIDKPDVKWWSLIEFAFGALLIVLSALVGVYLAAILKLEHDVGNATTTLDAVTNQFLFTLNTSVGRLCLPNLVPQLASDID